MCLLLREQTRHGGERQARRGTGSQEEGLDTVVIMGLRTSGLAQGLGGCVVRLVSEGLCSPSSTLHSPHTSGPLDCPGGWRAGGHAPPASWGQGSPPLHRPAGLAWSGPPPCTGPGAASLPVVSPDPALTFLDGPLFCPHSHSECVSVSLGLRLMWVLG